MSPSSSTFLLFTQQQHTVARLGTWFLTVCVSSNAHKSKHNERTRSLPKKSHISWTGHEHVFNISACKHDKLRFNQLWKCTLSLRRRLTSAHTQETNNFPIKTFLLSLQQIKLQIESNNIVFWKQHSFEIRPAWCESKSFHLFHLRLPVSIFYHHHLSASSFQIGEQCPWKGKSFHFGNPRPHLRKPFRNLITLRKGREVEIKTEEFLGWV